MDEYRHIIVSSNVQTMLIFTRGHIVKSATVPGVRYS